MRKSINKNAVSKCRMLHVSIMLLLCVFISTALTGCGQDKSSVEAQDSGEAPPPSPDPSYHLQDFYMKTGDSGLLTAGRHPWDAAKITVTRSYTVYSMTLRMHQVGSAHQDISVGIYNHNSQLDCPGTRIGNLSGPIRASILPRTDTDVTFSGLNSAVMPGTYWIVFHTDNYDDIEWNDRLNNHVIIASTNEAERGRTLSYENIPVGKDWSEFYFCQIRFALYGA